MNNKENEIDKTIELPSVENQEYVSPTGDHFVASSMEEAQRIVEDQEKTVQLYPDQEQQYVTPTGETFVASSMEDAKKKIEQMEKGIIDPLLNTPMEEIATPLSAELKLYEALDKKLDNDEVRTSITVSIPEDSYAKRVVLIDNEAYHFDDEKDFDFSILPQIYKKFTSRETEIITDQEDVKNGRFMINNDKNDTLVVLNIAPDVIENLQKSANKDQVKEEQKQFVKQKTRTTSLNTMGFVNGFSIGMGIGTAIVLLLVALMYFGIIKLW